MLKVPAWRYFSEQRVTAFQDDTMWWKFYLVPDYVTLRSEGGDPKFLLVKYAFGDDDRERDPTLPKGR